MCPLPGLPACHFPQVLLPHAHDDTVLPTGVPTAVSSMETHPSEPRPHVWAALCTTPGGAVYLRLCEKDALSSCAGTVPTWGLAASSSGPFMKLCLPQLGGLLPPLNANAFIPQTVIQCLSRVLSTLPLLGSVPPPMSRFQGVLLRPSPVLSWPTAAIFINMGQTGQGWSQNFGHTTDL